MSAVFRRYFEVTTPEVIAGAREVRARIKALREQMWALAEELGFKAAVERDEGPFGGLRLVGFAQPIDTLGSEWLVSKRITLPSGDKVYIPSARFRAGKQILKRMNALERIDEDREMLALTGLGKHSDIFGQNKLHFAVATFIDGDEPVVSVNLPFEEVRAEVPPSLIGATEVSEYAMRLRFAGLATAAA